jgi:hypothetical protein
MSVVALVIVAYWAAWYGHRSWVAVETGPLYEGFEGAFPLADGWLALCLVLGALALWRQWSSALLWLLAGAGAGFYLFGMDDLYDIQHHLWGKGANGRMELVINVITLVLSATMLRWTWRRRRALLGDA